ncbi:UNVERIFIED_CONTAM: hypothetical protein NCL1_44027 [Trichonephila clavipes]
MLIVNYCSLNSTCIRSPFLSNSDDSTLCRHNLLYKDYWQRHCNVETGSSDEDNDIRVDTTLYIRVDTTLSKLQNHALERALSPETYDE